MRVVRSTRSPTKSPYAVPDVSMVRRRSSRTGAPAAVLERVAASVDIADDVRSDGSRGATVPEHLPLHDCRVDFFVGLALVHVPKTFTPGSSKER